jgi:hypothetical protein
VGCGKSRCYDCSSQSLFKTDRLGPPLTKVADPARAKCKVGDVIVKVDPRYYRPTEVETLLGDPTKAKEKLGWVPKTTLRELVAERWSRPIIRLPSVITWSSQRATRPTTTTSDSVHVMKHSRTFRIALFGEQRQQLRV